VMEDHGYHPSPVWTLFGRPLASAIPVKGAGTRVLARLDHTLVLGAFLIVGFSVVFVSLGASFSAAGQFLLDYRDWIRIGGGVLIIVFGLYIAGVLRIGLFGRTQQMQIQSKPAGLLGTPRSASADERL